MSNTPATPATPATPPAPTGATPSTPAEPVPPATPPAPAAPADPMTTAPDTMTDAELAAAVSALTTQRQNVLARQRHLLAEADARRRRRKVAALEAELVATRGMPQVVGPGVAAGTAQVLTPGQG